MPIRCDPAGGGDSTRCPAPVADCMSSWVPAGFQASGCQPSGSGWRCAVREEQLGRGAPGRRGPARAPAGPRPPGRGSRTPRCVSCRDLAVAGRSARSACARPAARPSPRWRSGRAARTPGRPAGAAAGAATLARPVNEGRVQIAKSRPGAAAGLAGRRDVTDRAVAADIGRAAADERAAGRWCRSQDGPCRVNRASRSVAARGVGQDDARRGRGERVDPVTGADCG